jgi:hypothetical protein
MKKILFIALALALSAQVFAQQADTVYVVFTPTTGNVQGVWEHINNNYNTDLYRDPTRIYTIFSRPAGYFFRFPYQNRKNKPTNPILQKSLSFLNTVEYIDWDVVGPTLTKAQAEELIAEILAHDKIYFIPRNSSSQQLELVPVGLLRSRY